MEVILKYRCPEEAFLLKCAEEGVHNRMLLESLKTTLESHENYGVGAEVVLQEIKAQMRGWK
jgi:hypothetical protein